MCPSTFSYRGNISRHIATIHEGKKRTDMPPKEKSDGKGRLLYFDEMYRLEDWKAKLERA